MCMFQEASNIVISLWVFWEALLLDIPHHLPNSDLYSFLLQPLICIVLKFSLRD